MLRTMTIAAALALAGTMASSAAAQSWGFGVEARPRYYDGPPVVYRRAAPGYYGDAPVVLRRVEPRVFHMEAPEDVLDDLEDDGYSEMSPMRRRGQFYMLTAVDPDGNLVALDISIFTGEILNERILEARLQAPPRVRRAPRAAPVAAPPPAPRAAPQPQVRAMPAPARPSAGGDPSTLRDRLQAPAEPAEGEEDPLVVY